MLVVAGEALMDMVPATHDGTPVYEARPGGSPFNVAIGCARLGVPTAFLGRLSTDGFGRRLLAHLSDNDVDTRYVVDTEQLTALAFVHADEVGAAQYSFYMNGTAERSLRPEDVPADLDIDALHIGSIALVLEPLAGTVEHLVERVGRTATITLDPNIRPQFIPDRGAYRERLSRLVARADLVKVSDEDLGWLEPARDPVEVAREWMASGPGLVVVTRGADGAVAVTGTDVRAVPGRTVDVADTVGAGDSFMAALLAWLADRDRLGDALAVPPAGDELTDLLAWSVEAAAITCTRRGADPPARADLRGSSLPGRH